MITYTCDVCGRERKYSNRLESADDDRWRTFMYGERFLVVCNTQTCLAEVARKMKGKKQRKGKQ